MADIEITAIAICDRCGTDFYVTDSVMELVTGYDYCWGLDNTDLEMDGLIYDEATDELVCEVCRDEDEDDPTLDF